MTAAQSNRTSWLAGLSIFAAALAIRLGYIFTAEVDKPFAGDAGQYFRIAINLVRHGVFSTAIPGNEAPLPDTYRAPGYPAFVAIPFAITGSIDSSYWVVLICQALFGALSAVVVFRLCQRWLTTNYASVAALLVAFWPHLITQGGYILTESVFGAAVMVSILMVVRAVEADRPAAYLAAGVSFSVAVLVNQMLALLVLLLIPMLVRRRGWSPALLFLAAATCLPLAWAVRDARTQSPVALSSGARFFENVVVGMEPDFYRYYADQNDALGVAARKRVQLDQALYARDKNAAYRQVFTRLFDNPFHYVEVFARKPLLLWAWSIAGGGGDIYLYPMISSPFETNGVYRSIAAICHGLNLPMAIAAASMVFLLLLARWRAPLANGELGLAICALVFCYATGVYTLLSPDVRYATPFRAVEIILAVTFLARTLGYVEASRARTRHERDALMAPSLGKSNSANQAHGQVTVKMLSLAQ